MQGCRPHAQLGGWLNSHHTMPHRCKCGRITPRSRTDIQDPAWNSRDQVKNIPVEISKGNALVTLDQRFRFLGIPLCATHTDQRVLISFFESTSGVAGCRLAGQATPSVGNDSEAAPPVDPVHTEIPAVGREDQVASDLFGQHHQRRVGVVHGKAGVLVDQLASPAK